MKIDVFTIRNKETKELIYAEGRMFEEFSSFTLDPKWFTEKDLNNLQEPWYLAEEINCYRFDDEIKHLIRDEYIYDLIEFNLEEIEVN